MKPFGLAPKKKFWQSPIFKVTTAWAILIPLGLGIFVLARDDVKKRRRDIMLSKKRMFEPLALEDSQRYQESEIYRPREEKQDAEG